MSSDSDIFLEWKRRVAVSKRETDAILARFGNPKSRIVTIRDLKTLLGPLPTDVAPYFSEAVACLDNDLCRAAVVFSWAGFFRLLAEYTFRKEEAALKAKLTKRPFSSTDELLEGYSESVILEAARGVGVLKRADYRVLDGNLSFRNKCAHPTRYQPDLNVAIGFVHHMLGESANYI